MSENPYAPPKAAVADVVELSVEPPFFAVSIPKFLIMCTCTLSLYELYWFYRNWQRIRERHLLDVFPFTRAFFAPFFCYQCFVRIRDDKASAAVTRRLAAGPLALAWIVTSLMFVLPEPYDMVSYLSFGFLVPVQAHVNQMNAVEVPAHDRNAHLTSWNWAGIVVGGFVLLLRMSGYFVQAI